MKCKDCKYYSYVGGTYFCDSRNHKRKGVHGFDDAESFKNAKLVMFGFTRKEDAIKAQCH